MCDQFNGQFGFEPADDRCLNSCKKNPLILPKLYRYLRMGNYEILADVKDTPDKFFIFILGGENGVAADANYERMLKLTVADVKTLAQVNEHLSKQEWFTISYERPFDGGVYQKCVIHSPQQLVHHKFDEPNNELEDGLSDDLEYSPWDDFVDPLKEELLDEDPSINNTTDNNQVQ